jgi:hypothetical protein
MDGRRCLAVAFVVGVLRFAQDDTSIRIRIRIKIKSESKCKSKGESESA